MNESPHNVVFLCNTHAPKPDPKLHAHPPEYFVGRHVKLGFPAIAPDGSNVAEHMWVDVKSVTPEGRLEGVLDNDPVYDTEYANGDLLRFEVYQIEAVL